MKTDPATGDLVLQHHFNVVARIRAQHKRSHERVRLTRGPARLIQIGHIRDRHLQLLRDGLRCRVKRIQPRARFRLQRRNVPEDRHVLRQRKEQTVVIVIPFAIEVDRQLKRGTRRFDTRAYELRSGVSGPLPATAQAAPA